MTEMQMGDLTYQALIQLNDAYKARLDAAQDKPTRRR